MALYFYTAISRAGKNVSGYVDAATLQGAREQITHKGLYPTSVQASVGQSQEPWYKRLFQGRVSLKEKLFFTKQLAVLLKAGVPLVQSLDLLAEQTSGRLRSIVITLRDTIKEGKSLGDGLALYPAVFEPIYVQLVRAGEASGKLDTILERLTEYLARREELAGRVRGALRYPLIQLGVVFLVVIVLLSFVVPQIADVFRKQQVALPLPTRILMGMSDALLGYYWLIAIILGLIIGAFVWWKRTPSGSYTLDKLKLKLPIIGYFARMSAVVQFSRTLGMLIEGGVNLSEALNIVVQIVDNKVLADALIAARENIIKQGKISQYLKQTGIFPPLAIYLINTGEQSGQLDAMLLTVAQTYESELEDYADTLSSALGPIMLIVMAVIVGFVVLSIVLPMQQMGDVASKMAGRA